MHYTYRRGDILVALNRITHMCKLNVLRQQHKLYVKYELINTVRVNEKHGNVGSIMESQFKDTLYSEFIVLTV